MKLTLYPVAIAAMLTITTKTTYAQKLPNVQKNNLPAPANIKIDGKATEWNDTYQAYNKATEVYYTLANNNENLYLGIKAIDPVIIKKILGGGITFTISKTGQRNDPAPATITFPVIDPKLEQPSIMVSLGDFSDKNGPANKDSIINVVNKKLTAAVKEIKVKRLNLVDDSTVSVYNNIGLKTGISINKNGALVYELMVPLKFLKKEGKLSQFAYNIMLNVATTITRTVATGNVVVTGIPRNVSTNSGIDFQTIAYPTDFWGEYTLAQ